MERWEEGRITFEELVQLAEAFLTESDSSGVADNPQSLLALAFELRLPGLGEAEQNLERDQATVLQALLIEQQQEVWSDQADAIEEAERTLRGEPPDGSA